MGRVIWGFEGDSKLSDSPSQGMAGGDSANSKGEWELRILPENSNGKKQRGQTEGANADCNATVAGTKLHPRYHEVQGIGSSLSCGTVRDRHPPVAHPRGNPAHSTSAAGLISTSHMPPGLTLRRKSRHAKPGWCSLIVAQATSSRAASRQTGDLL